MIKGTHGIFFSSEPEAARAFLRDKLELDHVDDGGGWLIFGTPKGGEFGVHPGDSPGHQLSFWCDDIEETVANMKSRGVIFTKPVWEEPWGRVAEFTLPGDVPVMVYEPKHAQP